MTVNQQIITIVIVVLGTMTTRFLPFLLFPEGKAPPPYVLYLGKVLPYAAIGLLVVYCLKDAVTPPDYGLAEFLSIAVIVLIHKWKHSTLLSIAAGTGLYMAITQLLI